LEAIEGYAAFRCPNMRRAGEEDYPDVPRRLSGGSEERRQKKLNKDGMAEMVDSELHIVAICGEVWRNGTDRGVADEKIET
jgi:hypothetical protein